MSTFSAYKYKSSGTLMYRLDFNVNEILPLSAEDIANNVSRVNWELKLYSFNNYSFSSHTLSWYIAIAGLEIEPNGYKYPASINANGSLTIDSGTATISHQTDGSKLAYCYAKLSTSSGSYMPGTMEATGNLELTDIPRYATAYQSLNSKTSSSIKMNWSSDSTIDYIWYSKDNGSSWTGVDVADGTSGTYTISGLSPNTAYTIKTRVRRKDSQLTTDSSALSIATYAQTIPTISLASKTSSSITVTSGCNVAVSSTQYRIKKSGGSYGSYQTSATFSGLSANTTYIVEVRKVGSDSGEDGYAAVTVTTYAQTIPTISLSTKTVNSITVTSGCNVTISSTQYRIKKSDGSYGSYQTSATFSGLTPNTAYVVEVKKVGKDSGESGTATLSVTTYDIAKITSSHNINLGDAEVINISNPSGQDIKYYVEFITGNGGTATENLLLRNAVSGQNTIVFNDEELDKIYKKMISNNAIYIRVGVTTIDSYWHWADIICSLSGNQKTGHINVNGSWKRSKKWINVNGTWRRCVRWININGTWKRCI